MDFYTTGELGSQQEDQQQVGTLPMSLGSKAEVNFVQTSLNFSFVPCDGQEPTGVCLLLEGKTGSTGATYP